MQVDGNYNHKTWRASLCFLMRRALGGSGVSSRCRKKKRKSQMGMFRLYARDAYRYRLQSVRPGSQRSGFRATTDKSAFRVVNLNACKQIEVLQLHIFSAPSKKRRLTQKAHAAKKIFKKIKGNARLKCRCSHTGWTHKAGMVNYHSDFWTGTLNGMRSRIASR